MCVYTESRHDHSAILKHLRRRLRVFSSGISRYMWRNAGREAIQYDPKMLQKGQYGQASWSVSELSYESKNIMNYTDRVIFVKSTCQVFLKKRFLLNKNPSEKTLKCTWSESSSLAGGPWSQLCWLQIRPWS